MTIVVQKFGGSSLADVDQVRRVAELVAAERARGSAVLVVVSAMGKTTEQLLALARAAGASEPSSDTHGSLPRRELDLLVSTGERVSMALLAIALSARGVDAVSFTGSQAGIITEARHFDARILEIRPARLLEALERGRVVIVAGYQGVSPEREVTTLGRGGSDTTAVALAAVLGAARCEIYSDVDGIYSADPRQVSAARHLPSVDYQTLREMTAAGARVINARAVEWGQQHAVPIHARRTADFATGEGAWRETRVSARERAGARAVIVNSKLALLSTEAPALATLERGLAQSELEARDCFVEAGRAYLTLPLLSAPDFSARQAELGRRVGATFGVEQGLSELCAVGEGVERHAAELFADLTGARFCLVRPLRVSALVPSDHASQLERRWHQLWVEAA